MKLLKKYFELQEEIHNYFGYVEDWVTIPLDDSTNCYWYLTNETGDVWYSENKQSLMDTIKDDFDYETMGDDIYRNSVYTQSFLPKWVYRAEYYTMICVDTEVDGNKYLQVFDNTLEIKGEEQ